MEFRSFSGQGGFTGVSRGYVVITPGSGFGSRGEGFFRISAFNSRENVDEVCRRIHALFAG